MINFRGSTWHFKLWIKTGKCSCWTMFCGWNLSYFDPWMAPKSATRLFYYISLLRISAWGIPAFQLSQMGCTANGSSNTAILVIPWQQEMEDDKMSCIRISTPVIETTRAQSIVCAIRATCWASAHPVLNSGHQTSGATNKWDLMRPNMGWYYGWLVLANWKTLRWNYPEILSPSVKRCYMQGTPSSSYTFCGHPSNYTRDNSRPEQPWNTLQLDSSLNLPFVWWVCAFQGKTLETYYSDLGFSRGIALKSILGFGPISL